MPRQGSLPALATPPAHPATGGPATALRDTSATCSGSRPRADNLHVCAENRPGQVTLKRLSIVLGVLDGPQIDLESGLEVDHVKPIALRGGLFEDKVRGVISITRSASCVVRGRPQKDDAKEPTMT